MSEAKIDATGAAERMRKYRKKNQLKNGLTIAKQQFKRAQLLASGTPEGKKLRQDAAERKRRQRMRAKEAKEKENEEGGAKMPGCSLIIFITMIMILITFITIIVTIVTVALYHHHIHHNQYIFHLHHHGYHESQ